MLTTKTRVLLILPQEILDRARVLAGKATTAFKLPVSLQIVLRALIGEGLKRTDDPALLANVEGQAKAVRHMRAGARRGGQVVEKNGGEPGRGRHPASGRSRPGRAARPRGRAPPPRPRHRRRAPRRG